MGYAIRMGIPEMERLWSRLQQEYRSGSIKRQDEQIYKKWGKALKKLAENPSYPSLHTHEIPPLTKRYGLRVWQSYLEWRNAYVLGLWAG